MEDSLTPSHVNGGQAQTYCKLIFIELNHRCGDLIAAFLIVEDLGNVSLELVVKR